MPRDPLNEPGLFPDDSSPGEESDLDVEQAKAKLMMDFNLGQRPPEKITLEVLKQLIREKPERISMAIRKWLHPGAPD